MARTIRQALKEGKNGYHIGGRLILPFRCQLLKLVIKDEIHTEFVGNEHVKISQDPQNTSIYFRETGRLVSFLGEYHPIKMIAAEWDADLTDPSTHIKLIVELEDFHIARIKPLDNDSDVLFIE